MNAEKINNALADIVNAAVIKQARIDKLEKALREIANEEYTDPSDETNSFRVIQQIAEEALKP